MRFQIKIVSLLIFVLFRWQILSANPIPIPNIIHFITELKFDSTTWVLELRNNAFVYGLFEFFSLDHCYLTSTTDISFFRSGMALDSNYLVITADSLQTPFMINPDGDVISLFSDDGSEFDRLQFGNSCTLALRCPPAPVAGQSISLIDDCYYWDNTPTLGLPNDTLNAIGDVQCYITDLKGNPLSGINVWAEPLQISDYSQYGRYTKTDSNGYYSVHILAAWVSFYHWKNDWSQNVDMQVYPESTTTAHFSFDYIESMVNMNSIPIMFDYELSANYPNPFNNSTTFTYKIPIDDCIDINIFNIKGECVKNLYSGFQQAGHYRLSWNAHNVPSGIYIYQLKSANVTLSKKCLLVK